MRHLVKRVKAKKGEVRKLKWIGRSHAPDVLVLLPGLHLLVEGKKPLAKPRPGQMREHQRLRDSGFTVYVLDSIAAVDDLFNGGFK
jgi:hypothetical protein